jgi:beta-glucosidase
MMMTNSTMLPHAPYRDATTPIAADGQVAISLEVTNTGSRDGDEVVQLYVHSVQTSVTRPVKELKGFRRVGLAAGEIKTVTFWLDGRQLAFYDQVMAYVVEPGPVEVMVGASAQDIRLRGEFTICGAAAEVGRDKVFFSVAQVQ